VRADKNQALGQPEALRTLFGPATVDNVAVSKKHQQAKCSSCGSVGHKWPKCRARNVALMLVNIGAMPAEPLPLPPARPQQAAKAMELLLARAVMELNPALPATELAPKKIPENS
jgi:hypothetical protein